MLQNSQYQVENTNNSNGLRRLRFLALGHLGEHWIIESAFPQNVNLFPRRLEINTPYYSQSGSLRFSFSPTYISLLVTKLCSSLICQ